MRCRIMIEETAGEHMTTVYIDVLFFVNLIVNLMLYVSSCLIRRKRAIWWRVICAAAVGAVYSCAVFFSGTSPILYNIMAIILYLFCTWLVMGYAGVREYLKDAAATLFCAFVFAGIFFLIYRYADVGSVVVFNNNVLYIDIPVFALLCVSGVCFAVITLASKAFVQVIGAKTEYDVIICFDNHEIQTRAKIDTGNSMTDPISGYPVLLADYRKIIKLFPAHFENYMEFADISQIDPRYHRRLRMVMCKTATGEGILPALRPDYIRLTYNGKEIQLHNILIAVSKTDLSGFGLLLSPLIFKEAECVDTMA